MNYNICLSLPSNYFIIMTDNLEFNLIESELIKFDQLLKKNTENNTENNTKKNNTENYKGIIIFMENGNFSHYITLSENILLPLDLVTELLELIELQYTECYNNLNSTILTLQKKINEEGEYSAYKVKYDYDFNEHIYKKLSENNELYFLIHVFKEIFTLNS